MSRIRWGSLLSGDFVLWSREMESLPPRPSARDQHRLRDDLSKLRFRTGLVGEDCQPETTVVRGDLT